MILELLLDLVNTVKVLAEAVHLEEETLQVEVKDELHWQVLEDIELLGLTELVHVLVQLVLGCQHVVALKVVHYFLLAVGVDKLEVYAARHRCPLKVKIGKVLLLHLSPIGTSLENAFD